MALPETNPDFTLYTSAPESPIPARLEELVKEYGPFRIVVARWLPKDHWYIVANE